MWNNIEKGGFLTGKVQIISTVHSLVPHNMQVYRCMHSGDNRYKLIVYADEYQKRINNINCGLQQYRQY